MTAGRHSARARCTAIWLSAGLGLSPFVAGCASLSDKHEQRRIPQYGIIDPHQPRELDMVSLPSHVIEPPDELEIRVRPTALEFEQTTVVVQPDGTIDLGYFGELYVSGLTKPEVEQAIAEQLVPLARRKQLREPIQVAVRITNAGDSKRFYVLGVVNNQSSFPLTGNETVLDGILLAGLRSNSLPEKAYLVRPHPCGGPDQVFRIDWCGIKERGDTLTNYQLMPGDRIVVPGVKPPSVLSALLSGG